VPKGNDITGRTAARGYRIALIIGLAAFCAVPGPLQVALDLREGRSVQALDVFRHAPTQENLRLYEADLEKLSHVARWIRPRMQAFQWRLFGDAGEKGLAGKEGWFFYRPGVQYLVEPCPDLDEPLRAITAFRDALAERGIRLVVVPAPGKASVYPERLSRRASGAVRPVHAHTERLVEALQAAGVDVVDLFELCAEAKDEDTGEALYLAQDTHWSPEGMRLAADAVARRLLDSGAVQHGSTVYDLRPAPIRRRGDVIGMMQAPGVERRIEPAEVLCTQVIRRDSGEPYADDPRSEVLVLGDSFLRIYERDDPGSGGFVAHLARALSMPLASIVNDGGASTLVRQQLSGKPELLFGKKVVVWEFVERDIRFGTEGWQNVPLPSVAGDEGSRG